MLLPHRVHVVAAQSAAFMRVQTIGALNVCAQNVEAQNLDVQIVGRKSNGA